ncbi:MAG: DUF5665 domain-containing protein [Rhodobacteraceae bacterium]|nr:DUF5665 domain-containing protein [Paracoccaceae bacterium]
MEPQAPSDLEREIAALREQAGRLTARLGESVFRSMGRSFLKGVAFGLGSFLGATLVVSALLYSLASIDFIPIIGDWAVQIAERIQKR